MPEKGKSLTLAVILQLPDLGSQGEHAGLQIVLEGLQQYFNFHVQLLSVQ